MVSKPIIKDPQGVLNSMGLPCVKKTLDIEYKWDCHEPATEREIKQKPNQKGGLA